MDVRTQLLEAAEKLLDASPDRDVSTRAVCAAVGVGSPTLYRTFGDKNALLSAVVDYSFNRHLLDRSTTGSNTDPIGELTSFWDDHVSFATAHPAVYRLVYSPAFAQVPTVAPAALRKLHAVLERCAAAGRLRVDADRAAQRIMSAVVGVALNLVTQPETYPSHELSKEVRDAIYDSVLISPSEAGASASETTVAPAALQLAARLRIAETALGAEETSLLLKWLTVLSRETLSLNDGRWSRKADV